MPFQRCQRYLKLVGWFIHEPVVALSVAPRRVLPLIFGSWVGVGTVGAEAGASLPPQAGAITAHGARNAESYVFQCVAR